MATSVRADYVLLYAKHPLCICGMNSRGCSTQDGLQHNRILHWYRVFKEAGVYIIRVLAGQPQVSSLSVLYRQHQNTVHWNCCDGYCLRRRYHSTPVSVLAVVPRLVLNWMTSWTHIVHMLHLCCAYQIMHFVVCWIIIDMLHFCCAYQIMHFVVCWIVIVKFVSVLLPTVLNWSLCFYPFFSYFPVVFVSVVCPHKLPFRVKIMGYMYINRLTFFLQGNRVDKSNKFPVFCVPKCEQHTRASSQWIVSHRYANWKLVALENR